MTWRMEGLTRRTWTLSRSGQSRCLCCDWGITRRSPVWAGRGSRAHTRRTGHITRTAHTKVTEYRRAEQ